MLYGMVAVMDKRLYFYGGTLVLEGVPQEEKQVPPCFIWSHGKWRTEAYHYASILSWLRENSVQDALPRWQALNYTLHDGRQPHDYQAEALVAWQKAGYRGCIVLPTGAGKSYIAIRAIHHLNRSAVIVAPTIDLLHQWYRLLSHAFHVDIGVYYGGEKILQPLTVTTYASFGNLMSEYGNFFRILLADEVHHLPSPVYSEGALMSSALARLGLTATYPSEEEQQGDGRRRLDLLLGGPIVYSLNIDDLAGERLAAYRTERIRVRLTPAERQQYDRDFTACMDFVRQRNLLRQYGANWLRELHRLSARDPSARAALLARQRVGRLLAGCQEKLQAVDDLLREHVTEQVLVFTESNVVAYTIAQRYLVPVLTHLSTAAERKNILDGFQAKRYRAIVTSRILDEGVDLPSAKVAIILGGTAGARQYIQRLGRVLRRAENKQAVLYEVLVRDTNEEGKVQRRRAATRRQEEQHVYVRSD